MSSLNNLDKFRARIAAKQLCVGTVITLSDPSVSELLGDAGYDFSWIDMEHAPFELSTVLGHIMAARSTGMASFVRVASNDPIVIKPVLELVPAAIIVPMVKTAEDVLQAVRACRYPPVGIRGYSPRRGLGFGGIPQMKYLESADEQTMVFVQIEQIEAVRNIDAILKVPGLTGICLGPNDLSGSMGRLGRTTDPEVVAAIDTVLEKARRTELLRGVGAGYDPKTLQRWMERGIQWIGLNCDFAHLYQSSKAVLEGARHVEKSMQSEKIRSL